MIVMQGESNEDYANDHVLTLGSPDSKRWTSLALIMDYGEYTSPEVLACYH